MELITQLFKCLLRACVRVHYYVLSLVSLGERYQKLYEKLLLVHYDYGCVAVVDEQIYNVLLHETSIN